MPGERQSHFDWEDARRRLARLAEALDSAGRLDAQQAKRVMDERARHLAGSGVDAAEPTAALEVVTFRLASETFALETRFAREVMHLGEVTPLPGAPGFLLGVMNLRGEILPLVDLRTFFRLPHRDAGEQARVMILGDQRAELGVVVDEVSTVTTLPNQELHPASGSVTGAALDFLLGITSDGLLLLSGETLLLDSRLMVDESDAPP